MNPNDLNFSRYCDLDLVALLVMNANDLPIIRQYVREMSNGTKREKLERMESAFTLRSQIIHRLNYIWSSIEPVKMY